MLYLPTGEETVILQQFKKVVQDLGQNDVVLIRFLRARDYDLDNAETMLRNAVEWRKEIGVDNYLKWTFPPNYYSYLKYQIFGKDYNGVPICWLSVGKWPVKQLVEKEETEQVSRYIYTIMEKSVQKTAECGTPGYLIIDMDGLTYTQATHIPSLKIAFHVFQKLEQCYPEIIAKMWIINAPWIFSFAWNFVKGVFAQRTLEKITIFGCKEEWHAEFLRMIPRESIVPELQPPSE
ncbi:unnamed protein product [Orchesella dallaii]|uniref:CRAL-TRIO domain-containing protein n=1 Tax=Orchesella dallaii TaxID=48710 RepID=A0ABP1S6K0_9HEXA